MDEKLTLSPKIYKRGIYNAHDTEAECFEAGKKIQLEHDKDIIFQYSKPLNKEAVIDELTKAFDGEQVRISGELKVRLSLSARQGIAKAICQLKPVDTESEELKQQINDDIALVIGLRNVIAQRDIEIGRLKKDD